MKFWLTHYRWMADNGSSYWSAPRQAIASIDLLDNQSENPPTPNQDRPGCFCVTPNDVNLRDSYLLGRGRHPSEISVLNTAKSAWQQHNGGYSPNGNTVFELLQDHFQNIQDCLMPEVDRRFKIYLGAQRPINVWPLQLKQANTHRTRMLGRYRKMMDQAFQGNLESVRGRKVLDKLIEDLFGLRSHEARQDLWRREKDTLLQYLLPPNVRNTQGPVKHDTLLTDDFEGDLSNWTVIEGTWDTSNGNLRRISGNGYHVIYYSQQSLASDGHYAQNVFNSGSWNGPVVRVRELVGEADCYLAHHNGGDFRYISKMINGSITQLKVNLFTSNPQTENDIQRLQADGSEISYSENDGEITLTVTDSSISGNLYTGYQSWSNAECIKSWQAEELNPPVESSTNKSRSNLSIGLGI